MTYPDPYRRILNRMGYYDYQKGLIYRHLSQEGRWDSHLQNCRSFILKAVGLFKPDTVTVIGSGWLLDLPLAEIVDMNIRIRLVDIVHPPEVRQQVAQFSGIELCEEDVTGGLVAEVWKKAGNRFLFNKLKTIGNISVPDYNPSGDQGMVVSLNILTQLESLPLSFLEKHATVQEEELLGFRKAIQEKHLVFLQKQPSVLITDISEVVTEKSGLVSTIPNLLVVLPDGKYSEEWIWDFDLTGSDYYNRKSIMKMKAVII